MSRLDRRRFLEDSMFAAALAASAAPALAAEPSPAPRTHDARSTEQQIADLEREMHLADLEEQVRRRRAEGGAGTAG